MEQLLEDYDRRLKTVTKMLDEFKSNGSVNDIKKHERLATKAAEYRAFIAELEKVIRKNSAIEEAKKKIRESMSEEISIVGRIKALQREERGVVSDEDYFTDSQLKIIKIVEDLTTKFLK